MMKSERFEVSRKKNKENDMQCGILKGFYFAPIPYRIFRLSGIPRNWLWNSHYRCILPQYEVLSRNHKKEYFKDFKTEINTYH